MPGKRTLYAGLALGLLGALGAFVAIAILRIGSDSTGGIPAGQRLERIRRSSQFDGNEFVNAEPVSPMVIGDYWQALRGYLSDGKARQPSKPLPSVAVDLSGFNDTSSLQIVWLGHATQLVRLDGVTILIDPIFDNDVQLLASRTRRFQPPLARSDLPPIDGVIISHDHYDHLEMSTVKYLAARGATFIVPLGIGAHLEKWEVPEKQIVELDWWDSSNLGSVTFTCTPARHFSGRVVTSLNSTLWSSWAIVGLKHRLFYSGDTGYGKHFREIGERFGPFDVASLQIGAYGKAWPEIHMTPEEALTAFADLRGIRLLPVHWGTFDLAPHPWAEPIQRLAAATRDTSTIIVPRFGQVLDVGRGLPYEPWWEDTGDEASER